MVFHSWRFRCLCECDWVVGMDTGVTANVSRFVVNNDTLMEWGIFDNERNLQCFTLLPTEEVAVTLLAAVNTAYGILSE